MGRYFVLAKQKRISWFVRQGGGWGGGGKTTCFNIIHGFNFKLANNKLCSF